MFLFLENICPLNKGFHLKNTIFNLFECRQRYFLPLSKRCVWYLHHKEAVNCEILMSISDGSWKGSSFGYLKNGEDKNHCRGKGRILQWHFCKTSPPISMIYINSWLPYPTPLIKNNFTFHHLFIMHPFLLIFGWATSPSYLLMNIL